MKKCIDFLTKIRILDYEGNFSITNFLVYVMLFSAFLGTVNAIFAVAVLALYGFSRFLRFKRGQVVAGAVKTLLDNQVKQATQIKELKDQITSLSLKAGIMTGGQLNDMATKLRKF